MTTKKIFLSSVVLLLVAVNIIVLKVTINRLMPVNVASSSQLPLYDSATLLKYDGTDPNQPVLIGLNGYVYDVSPGRDDYYAPGQSYHHLAGKNSSGELNLIGGDIIKNKYKIVGKLQK